MTKQDLRTSLSMGMHGMWEFRRPLHDISNDMKNIQKEL